MQAIENAISRGDKGILITPNGPGVNPAITKARDAGLFVIALDTPPDPADTVDITFATDNFKAGELIGKWTAAQLGGKQATIAMLDLFNDKVVSVDYNRDQGFLTGMGIDTEGQDEERRRGRRPAPTPAATTRSSATSRPRATRTAARPRWRSCLSKNPDINVVYTINEPAAAGASSALQGGREQRRADRVGRRWLRRGGQRGSRTASSARPRSSTRCKMAQLGVEAITTIARGGEAPAVTPGLDFYDTGVALVTDKPVDRRRQHHHRRGREDLLGLTHTDCQSAGGTAAGATGVRPAAEHHRCRRITS